MKKLLIAVFALLMLLFTSCGEEADMQETTREILTLDSVDHAFATELLRLNILAEYGGVFRQMQMYHAEIFDFGVPCDSILQRELLEDGLPKYSLTVPVEIDTKCQEAFMTYNNRWYRGYQQIGTQTAVSELAAIEVKLEDEQVIAGNVEDDVYTYGQHGNRSILITKGVAAELDPTAELVLIFPNCNYDQLAVQMTDVVKATFSLVIATNEWPTISTRQKRYEGTIQLVEGRWTIEYEDGVTDFL